MNPLLILLILVLLFGGGGWWGSTAGFFAGSPFYGPAFGGLGFVVLIVVLILLFR